MALIISDLVKETTTTTGTGAKTLAGARAPAARTVGSVLANGDTAEFTISHDTLNEWEIAVYTYASGPNTLTRVGSPLASSNGGAAVNFSAGTKKVDLVLPAARIRNFVGPVQIGATSFGSGSLSFSNANGVSFSLSTNSNGGTIHASHNGLTTVAATREIGVVSHVGAGSVGSVSRLAFSNASNVTWSLSTAASAVTVIASVNPAFNQFDVGAFVSNSITTLTASTIVATDAATIRFPELNTSNDSLFSYANVLWRFQTGGVQHSARQAAFQRYFGSGIAGGVSAQQVSFSNANGVTFGIASSTSAGFGVIPIYTASVAAGGGGDGITSVILSSFANSQFLSWSNATDSAIIGSSVHLNSLGTNLATGAASLANVSFRVSSDSLLAGVIFSWLAPGTAGFTAGFGQLFSFSNANGVSWDISTSNTLGARAVQFIASVNPELGLISHVGGNSVGSATRLAFSNASNVTWSLSTAAGAATVLASVAAVPTHTLAVSAAGASASNGTVVWSNSNNVSFGQAGSTITASATVAATRELGIVSHIGGNVVSSVSQLAFSNASNVTWSLSTAAGAATVIASVAAGGGGGATLNHFMLFPGELAMQTVSTGAARTAGSLWMNPLWVPDRLEFNALLHMISFSQSTAQTASVSFSNLIGIYTRGTGASSTGMSLLHSITTNIAFTMSGTASTNSRVGAHLVSIPWASTITPGEYWLAFQTRFSMNGGNTSSVSISQGMVSQAVNWNGLGFFNVSSTVTSRQFPLGQGFYSTTTGALPGSIAFNQINGANTNASSIAARRPWIQLLSATV